MLNVSNFETYNYGVTTMCDIFHLSSILRNEHPYLGYKVSLNSESNLMLFFWLSEKKNGEKRLRFDVSVVQRTSDTLSRCDSDKPFNRSISIDFHKLKLSQYSF